MFVRKKSNRSGSTSVVFVEKRGGKTCYLKTISISSEVQEIDDFLFQGKKWILQQKLTQIFGEILRRCRIVEVVRLNFDCYV